MIFPTSIIWRIVAAILIVLSIYAGFRLWLHAHDSAILQGYVLLSEKTAAEARANELERQRNAATQALEEYRKRAVADALTQQKLEAQLEEAIRNDNANPDDGDYRWTRDDELWLCKQRGEAHCSR
ncbi:hypothetical protein [Agrobacterium cavarae]|uniref:hypothetical protein n=1 Tax=Agrobacterium cavarae TaxID=2528239 RepID=UPI0028996AA3|nr:hypothetical protein [Agrobacterium cavarae]